MTTHRILTALLIVAGLAAALDMATRAAHYLSWELAEHRAEQREAILQERGP